MAKNNPYLRTLSDGRELIVQFRNKEEKVQLGVYVTQDVKDFVEDLAAEQRTSMSEIVHVILKKYRAARGKKEKA